MKVNQFDEVIELIFNRGIDEILWMQFVENILCMEN
jgi:hypothetical protein